MALDAQEINDLFGGEAYDLETYQDVQWYPLSDQGSNYNQQIIFDNLAFMGQLCTLEDAFITVPIDLSGTGWVAGTDIATKFGTASIFSGIQLQSASGTTILYEQDSPFHINPIRNLIEMNTTSLISQGPLMQYSPDIDSSITYSAGVSGNLGFGDRVKFLKQQCPLTNTTHYQGTFVIQLKDIHDYFKQITFPQINFRWILRLLLAAPINPNATCNAFTTSVTAGFAARIHTDATAAAGQVAAPGSCKLYMKTVKLDPASSSKLLNKLNNKWEREVRYLESTVYKFATNVPAGSNTYTIETSATNARRVWVYGVPNGNVASAGDTHNVDAKFSRCNLLVNQKPWREYAYTQDIEFYNALREQCRGQGLSSGDGCLVNFQHWRGATVAAGLPTLPINAYYVFDLSRLGNRLNRDSPCTLQVELTTVNANYDYYAILEREAAVKFSISNAMAVVAKAQ